MGGGGPGEPGVGGALRYVGTVTRQLVVAERARQYSPRRCKKCRRLKKGHTAAGCAAVLASDPAEVAHAGAVLMAAAAAKGKISPYRGDRPRRTGAPEAGGTNGANGNGADGAGKGKGKGETNAKSNLTGAAKAKATATPKGKGTSTGKGKREGCTQAGNAGPAAAADRRRLALRKALAASARASAAWRRPGGGCGRNSDGDSEGEGDGDGRRPGWAVGFATTAAACARAAADLEAAHAAADRPGMPVFFTVRSVARVPWLISASPSAFCFLFWCWWGGGRSLRDLGSNLRRDRGVRVLSALLGARGTVTAAQLVALDAAALWRFLAGRRGPCAQCSILSRYVRALGVFLFF